MNFRFFLPIQGLADTCFLQKEDTTKFFFSSIFVLFLLFSFCKISAYGWNLLPLAFSHLLPKQRKTKLSPGGSSLLWWVTHSLWKQGRTYVLEGALWICLPLTAHTSSQYTSLQIKEAKGGGVFGNASIHVSYSTDPKDWDRICRSRFPVSPIVTNFIKHYLTSTAETSLLLFILKF